MVGLVLGALLVGVVLQFVTGQTRIASGQAAREEVQQNARGALEVVASDLRAAISRGLISGGERDIRFMLARRWGVVCGGNGTTQTVAVFPAVANDPVPAGPGAGLLMADRAANAGTWLPQVPALATVAAAPAAAANSCAAVAPAGQVQVVTLTGTNHPAPQVGAEIAVYQLVRYDVAAGQGGVWLRRSDGGGIADINMQPMAGPVDSTFVRFTYLAGNPPAEIAAPGANAAAANVQMIGFQVRTLSRQRVGDAPKHEDGTVTVDIRN